MQTKQAVDSTTEEYWAAYFGPYGKQWVRKIPRRIAQALAQRTAGLDADATTRMAASTTIVPLTAGPVITTDRVFIEAAADSISADGTKSRRVFVAEFDHDGKLLSIDSVVAPVRAE